MTLWAWHGMTWHDMTWHDELHSPSSITRTSPLSQCHVTATWCQRLSTLQRNGRASTRGHGVRVEAAAGGRSSCRTVAAFWPGGTQQGGQAWRPRSAIATWKQAGNAVQPTHVNAVLHMVPSGSPAHGEVDPVVKALSVALPGGGVCRSSWLQSRTQRSTDAC